MQAGLLIAFLLLWNFNKDICTYFFPYVDGLGCDKEVWENWYYLREKLRQVMFLIAVFIPFNKATVFSKAVAMFGVIQISMSNIDYFNNNFDEKMRDWFIVIPCAVFIAYSVYYRLKKTV